MSGTHLIHGFHLSIYFVLKCVERLSSQPFHLSYCRFSRGSKIFFSEKFNWAVIAEFFFSRWLRVTDAQLKINFRLSFKRCTFGTTFNWCFFPNFIWRAAKVITWSKCSLHVSGACFVKRVFFVNWTNIKWLEGKIKAQKPISDEWSTKIY